VFECGREDVDDATAHRELPAPLDQVDPVIGGCRKSPYDVLEVCGLTLTQRHRLEVTETLHLWLQHGADRRDDHPNRSMAGRVVVGMNQPAKHGQPAADGVRAWRQSLVRQRFPCRELDDGVLVQQAARRLDDLLRFPCRRRHDEHGRGDLAAVADRQRGGDERSQRGRRRQVERRRARTVQARQRPGERRLTGYDRKQSTKGHGQDRESSRVVTCRFRPSSRGRSR
jgi:hypothetical protein